MAKDVNDNKEPANRAVAPSPRRRWPIYRPRYLVNQRHCRRPTSTWYKPKRPSSTLPIRKSHTQPARHVLCNRISPPAHPYWLVRHTDVERKPMGETRAQPPAEESEPPKADGQSTKLESEKSNGRPHVKQEPERPGSGNVEFFPAPATAAIPMLPNETPSNRSEQSEQAKAVVSSSAPSLASPAVGHLTNGLEPTSTSPNPTSTADLLKFTSESNSSPDASPNRERIHPSSESSRPDNFRGPDQQSPQNKGATALDGQSPVSSSQESGSKPGTLADVNGGGWVPVPNSARVLVESGEEARAAIDSLGNGKPASNFAVYDARSHAAKDVSFEQESPRAQIADEPVENAPSSIAGVAATRNHRSTTASGRVDPVPHVVETNENFWTISRLYYSSGRYYRALWKANADKYPEMDKLSVNDVIMIPPVEDLDSAYIDPPRSRTRLAFGTGMRTSSGESIGQHDSPVLKSSINHEDPVSALRSNRSSSDGVPVRRSSRNDVELDLPATAVVNRRNRSNLYDDHHTEVSQNNDNDEPEKRTAARPRGRRSAVAPTRSTKFASMIHFARLLAICLETLIAPPRYSS